MFLFSACSVSAALSTAIVINDTDTFYSSYVGNDIIHLVATVTNDSAIIVGYANFTNFNTSCGTGGIVDFSRISAGIYNASCNVSALAANSNFAAGVITTVFAQGNGLPPDNVSIKSPGQIPVIVLYNMTTPPSPPDPCTKFGL